MVLISSLIGCMYLLYDARRRGGPRRQASNSTAMEHAPARARPRLQSDKRGVQCSLQISVKCLRVGAFPDLRPPPSRPLWQQSLPPPFDALCVALHIVSNIFRFVHSFFRNFTATFPKCTDTGGLRDHQLSADLAVSGVSSSPLLQLPPASPKIHAVPAPAGNALHLRVVVRRR